MFYIDCDCTHDHWGGYETLEEAKEYFDTLNCKSKILYKELNSGEFQTLQEVQDF
jgi:hypothetical protein